MTLHCDSCGRQVVASETRPAELHTNNCLIAIIYHLPKE